MAATFDGGVVLGADSRTSTGNYIANRVTDKLTQLTDKVRHTAACTNQMLEPCRGETLLWRLRGLFGVGGESAVVHRCTCADLVQQQTHRLYLPMYNTTCISIRWSSIMRS